MLVNRYKIPQEKGEVVIDAIQYIWCNAEEVLGFINSDMRQGVSGHLHEGTISIWNGSKFASPDIGDYIVYCPYYGSYRVVTKEYFERSKESPELLNLWK